ncbi:MAG TPA: phosphomannomutase/phosphoglucomutase [Myxococcota bacterium]|nr:phosphomannomutase/phosphoglucomutase [Myxococcota bacterium]
MKPAIFKAYDIRGVAPDELDGRAALAIGRAFARHVARGPIAVGWDMRASAQELRSAFVRGITAEGLDVIEIGRVSTPVLYFATATQRAGAGAMITASHNPGRYNGFKLCGQNAVPIGIESGLAAIRDRALALADEPAPPTRGRVSAIDVKDAYYRSLLELFPARPRLRAVVDAGNGIAGEALAGLFDRLPLETTRLYFEPDGSFPHHEADPLKLENLRDLQSAVREKGAQLGIAFDGDGDRAVFVDETGEAVPADLMTALFCDVILERKLLGAGPGVPILYDLRSSRVVPETLRARGAEPVRSRVGHAFMKAVMRERGACFGGELSGHYYFRFPAGYIADDGAAAMLLLLEALALRGRPLSELWRPYRKYRQSGEINRRVADVPATLARVRAQFRDGEADELDGLTIGYPDWWFNLRPSNTEPLLRLNLEAPDDASLARHRDGILALIDS